MKKIVFLILLITLFLRFYRLGEIPFGPEHDEASVGYNAFTIATAGKDEWGRSFPLIFEAFGDFKNPFYIYLTSLVVKIGGLSLFTTRFIEALVGSLYILTTGAIAYLFSRKRVFALLTMLLLAFSPFGLFFSRMAGDGFMLSAFLINLGILCLMLFVQKKHVTFYFLSLFSFIFSMFSYNLARIVSPFFLILTLFVPVVVWGKKNRTFFLMVVCLVCLAGAFGLIYKQSHEGAANRIQYVGVFGDKKSTVLQIDEYRSEEGNSLKSRLAFNKGTFFLLTLTSNYLSHFGTNFLGNIQKPSLSEESGYPPLPFFLTPFYYIGIIMLIVMFVKEKEKQKRLLLLILLMWIFLSPLPSAITEGAPSGKRSLASLGSYELMAVLGWMTVYKKIVQKRMQILFTGLTVFLFILYMGSFLQFFFGPYADTYAYVYHKKENIVGTFVADHYASFDSFIYSKKMAGQPYIFPVFHLSMPLSTLEATRVSYKKDSWHFADEVGKMSFPDTVDQEILCNLPQKKHTVYFLTFDEYRSLLGSSCLMNFSVQIMNPEAEVLATTSSLVYKLERKGVNGQ